MPFGAPPRPPCIQAEPSVVETTAICRFCHATCGLKVTIEQGRVVDIIGDIDNPVLHDGYELFAAIVRNLIATVPTFGERTQIGATHLASSFAAGPSSASRPSTSSRVPGRW